MLSFLFPRSTQITSALGALNAANLGLSVASRNCTLLSLDEQEKPPILCLVLGDGGDPRTAVLAVIQKRWSAVAIDPNLDAKWEKSRELLPDGCRFMGFRGSMTRFLAEGYKMVQSSLCPLAEIQHLVIICVEQGANFDQLKSLGGRLGLDDLRILFNNVPSTVVSISSDEILHECPLKSPPDHTLVDQDILASNRRVQVWNFHTPNKPSTPSPSINSSIFHTMGPRNALLPHRHNIRRLYGESIGSGSLNPAAFVPSSSISRFTNSKVAQLQRQQELARHNRIKLSHMRISEQAMERERHNSADASDGICRSLHQSGQDKSPPNSCKPPRASIKNSLSRFARGRRFSILPKIIDSNDHSNLCETLGNKPDPSGLLMREKSQVITMTFDPAPASDSVKTNPVCLSIPCKRSDSGLHSTVEDCLLDFTGVTPPSSMASSADASQARIHGREPVPFDVKSLSTKSRTASSYDSSLSERSTPDSTLQEDDSDLSRDLNKPRSIAQHDYKLGDIVEVRVDNLYQVGMVESQPFKGVYNITLFSDTPAWNKKRAHRDIYKDSAEHMPEVLARDIRLFTPVSIGEIIYEFVNGRERKYCVHGYLHDESDESSPASHMKYYLVKFAEIDDILLDFAGLTPPSSMSRSASECPTTHDKKPVPCDDKTFSSKTRTESTCDSSLSERTESISNSTMQDGDAGPPKTQSRPTSITQNDYKPGDVVEVKVHNLYQVGMVDNQPFKGVYNVTLFSDTPAWNEKRAHVDIYRCSPERLPEVLARDIRPFTPAPIGEIIYVFVNRSERKCCVHGYLYDKSDAPSPAGLVKWYLVRFAGNDDDWGHEEHRVPFKRAYRKICSACG
ncbi:hypothetical protein ACHAW6_007115 [Cyclotella cf. meneghiniana]